MKNILSLALILFCSAIISCKKNVEAVASTNSSSTQQLIATTGNVSGKVTDSRGNALAGVKITIEHAVWHGTYLYATTDINGKYKINLPSEPAGDWVAHAQLSRSGWGKDYCLIWMAILHRSINHKQQ